MSTTSVSGSDERADAAERPLELVFATLWEALADLLGTAATATLLRRAAQRATWRCPEHGELIIADTKLDYSYSTPPAWKDRKGDPSSALRELFDEPRPLLVDLTGAVVINHLGRTPELRQLGFISAHEEQS